MSKVEVPVKRANRLINHGCVILVTSAYKQHKNIITLAWQMPVSHRPMLIAIAVHKEHFSHELIQKSREFGINVPHRNLIREVHLCGIISGREVDKFQYANLPPQPAKHIKAPLIKECVAHLECKVKKIYPGGDHSIFVGTVLRALAERDVFNGKFLMLDKTKYQTLHHLGEDRYMVSGEIIRAVI